MNVRHRPDRTASESRPDRPHPSGNVESASTRVLLDGPASKECVSCGADIPRGSKYRCVTVRSEDGRVSELSYCGGDCSESVGEGPTGRQRVGLSPRPR